MLKSSLRILGILLMLFTLTLLPPSAISLFSNDGAFFAFALSMSVTFIVGFFCFILFGHTQRELRTRDGFLIVVLFWTSLCLVGALPFLFLDSFSISLADAFFESVSGFTTTGATIIAHIDKLPVSILYYRQQLQFLGGMGIIVLAVAILPMLGIGGLQLFKAETTGPVKDNKLTPRIAETAKALWLIYVTLTIICTVSYWLLGMSLFDALGYAFATISTGGYAPHDTSMGYYSNPSIHLVSSFFMVAGAISFSLHFTAFQKKSLLFYLKDSECQTFFYIIILSAFILFYTLIQFNHETPPFELFAETLFQIISFLTTTGFTTVDYSLWPLFSSFLLFLLGIMGGCAGSTTGGLKIIRLQLLFKQGMRELKRLIHPSGQFLIKLDNKSVPNQVIEAVWGFIAIYIAIFVLLTFALLACGLDFTTAFASIIGTLGNVGPGLGSTLLNYHDVNEIAKWIFSIAMLIGRLEIFTIFVLLTPDFWKS